MTSPPGTRPAGPIERTDELRAFVGEPMREVQGKEMPGLDRHSREFLARCPFLVLATVGGDGHVDVSPRGDPPGFVHVIDDNTIVLPDRKGNRRVDSMTNILENPQVGLILFMPGYEETVRIRGRAALTTDPGDLAGMAVNQKAPELGIKVAIDTVFYHCAKALRRAKLWDPASQAVSEGYPRFAQIIHDQYMQKVEADDIDVELQKAYRNDLY
jgi:PPOX class probable FMN-dependent enzyme